MDSHNRESRSQRPSNAYQSEREAPESAQEHDQDDRPVKEAADTTRHCSIKGCNAVLWQDYEHKMCEACRGRHRIYAMTKRAKRKMEKAALNGSGFQNEDGQGLMAISTTEAEQLQEVSMSNPPSSQYGFSSALWNSNTLDPQLFPHSSSSELAGAMGFPTPSVEQRPTVSSLPQRTRHTVLSPSTHKENAILADLPGSSIDGPPSFTKPKLTISVEVLSEAATQLDDVIPPRFCSIKGCKTVLSGSTFYKMCEPCRGKYRNYGTKKRRKWRDDKEVAVAELEQFQQEEIERINQGLTPLELRPEWQFDFASPQLEDPQSGSSISIARMCTVSHCREILPPSHKYLRCERHRVQNRHHSKLKRVRDKESKAQVVANWVAARAGQPSESKEQFSDGEQSDANESSDQEQDSVDTEKGQSVDPALLQSQTTSDGFLLFPPGSRGRRRSNHICSSKTCRNLLSLESPWKTCEPCRLRDRARVRSRSERLDEGEAESSSAALLVVDGAPLIKRKRKKSSAPPNRSQEGHAIRSTAVARASRSGRPDVLVFMDPIVPPEDSSVRHTISGTTIGYPPTIATSSIASHATTVIVNAPSAISRINPPSPAAVAGVPYHVPYYMPPFGLTPYPGLPGFTYSPGPSDTAPIYPAPYPPYGPYPPYAFIPHPYAQLSMHVASPQAPTGSTPQAANATSTAPQPPWAYPMNASVPPTLAKSTPASPAEPLHTESMYSIWPSRAWNKSKDKGAAENVPGLGDEPVSLTFLACTGEEIAHKSLRTYPNRRKRRRVDHAAVAEWHRKHAATQQTNAEVDPSSSATRTLPQADSSAAKCMSSGPEINPSSTEMDQRVCRNKTCGRVLAAEALGTICERCKGRLKRRVLKLKQRSKLIPRQPIFGSIVAKGGGVGSP